MASLGPSTLHAHAHWALVSLLFSLTSREIPITLLHTYVLLGADLPWVSYSA